MEDRNKVRIRHSIPSADIKEPYANCRAGRKEFGRILTTLVTKPEIGCTIALNGAWGNGKTTFLNMWQKELESYGYPTVLLNAWETEWAEDPLIAVIACIKDACKEDSAIKATIKDIEELFKGFYHNPLRTLSLIAGTGSELAGIDADDKAQKLAEITQNAFLLEVNSFKARKDSMMHLQTNMEKLAWKVNQDGDKKPLVFIIDELDRCKPDYSIRMLEVLKHFFAVNNIIFVCAIDKKHIKEAIRGYYGSEGIDSEEYLRRFFDLEVELPDPDYKTYVDHLYSFYDMGAFFESEDRKEWRSRGQGEEFNRFMADIAKRKSLTLRQLERIYAFSRIYMDKSSKRFYYYPDMAVFLTYLRFFDTEFYNELKNHRLKAQEVLDKFVVAYGSIIDKKRGIYNSSNNRRGMLYLICELICSYSYRSADDSESVYDHSTDKALISNPFFDQEETNEVMKLVVGPNSQYSLDWLFQHLEFVNLD